MQLHWNIYYFLYFDYGNHLNQCFSNCGLNLLQGETVELQRGEAAGTMWRIREVFSKIVFLFPFRFREEII